MLSLKSKNSTPSAPDGAPAPGVKKPKKGSILQDQTVSIRKINAGREGKINFAARMNMVFAIILLLNVAYSCYKITAPRPPSAVFVQYFSQAGLMVPIQALHVTQLPLPRLDAAAVAANAQPAASEPSAAEAPAPSVAASAPSQAQAEAAAADPAAASSAPASPSSSQAQ